MSNDGKTAADSGAQSQKARGTQKQAGVVRRKPNTLQPQNEWVIRLLEPMKGKPLANKSITIKEGESEKVVCKTDAKGILRILVDKDPTTIVLEFDDHAKIKLNAGKLEPTKVSEGVKQRLYSLGYGQKRPTEWTKDEYRGYLLLFQKNYGVPEGERKTDSIGPKTLEKLEAVHEGREKFNA